MKQKFADLSAIALYLGEKWGLPVCSFRGNDLRFRIMAPSNVPILECYCSQDRSDGLWSIIYTEYRYNDPDHDPAMWKLI